MTDRLRLLWDFDDLDATGERFRALIEAESGSGRAEVLTQLARLEGLRGDSDAAILADADALAALIRRRPFALTAVSNEVGEGVHPETADGLHFRDLLGVVNQRVAAAAERVVLMVAGIPLEVKTPAHESPIPTLQTG